MADKSEPVKGQKGGEARAAKMTKEERSEAAKLASLARWSKDLPKAICGAPDRPLVIGDVEIPCYVIEGEKRVLVQRAVISAMKMARGSSSKGGGDRLAHFVNQKRLESVITNELKAVTGSPIRFVAPNGQIAHGYEAEYLAELCFAVLDAEKAGLLQKQQEHIATQCRILIKGFSIVGINALVDEATGYQQVRAKDALAKILDRFIAKELQAWTKTFPIEFYEQIFRLRGWPFDPTSVKRPACIGQWTNDIVYDRLAPGVLEELKAKSPAVNGRRKHKLFQWLTGDIGHPKLLAHIESVKAIMILSDNWEDFRRNLDRVHRKLATTDLGFEVEVKATPARTSSRTSS